jgi:hypothetical protein
MSIISLKDDIIEKTLQNYVAKEVINSIIMKYLPNRSIKFFCKKISCSNMINVFFHKNKIHIIERKYKKYRGCDSSVVLCHYYRMDSIEGNVNCNYELEYYKKCYISRCNDALYLMDTTFGYNVINYAKIEKRNNHLHSSGWAGDTGKWNSVVLSNKYTFIASDKLIYRKEHYLFADPEYKSIGHLRGSRTKTSRRINFSRNHNEQVICLIVIGNVLCLITSHKMALYTFDLKKLCTIKYSDRVLAACSNDENVLFIVRMNSTDINESKRERYTYIDVYNLNNMKENHTHLPHVFDTIKIRMNNKIKSIIHKICASINDLYMFTYDSKIFTINIKEYSSQ